MPLLFGLAPGHRTAAVYDTSTKHHESDFWINKISFNDQDKIDEMFQNLKINAEEQFKECEFGTVAIYLSRHDYSYDNKIRKKFIASGIAAGFKSVEIIDAYIGIFYDALRQSKFQPENGSVVWIYEYGKWYIWKKANGENELIYYQKRDSWITDEMIQKFEDISGKMPDLVIFGQQIRDWLISFFSSRYNIFICESLVFAEGALIHAKIMAGKKKFLDFKAKNVLGRDLKLVVGLMEVINFKPNQSVPLEKILKLKKDANDLVLNICDGSSEKQLQLPPSDTCIVVIKIGKNGIFNIAIPSQAIITITEELVDIFNVGTQLSVIFPATIDYSYDPPKVGCNYIINSVSSGFITNFDKKQSKISLKLILEKCLNKIGNCQVFLVHPNGFNEEKKEIYGKIAKSAGFANVSIIDECFATLLKEKKYEEINLQ